MTELHVSIAGARVRFEPNWFPMLIHGAGGSGVSLATIVIAAELVRAEESVVFLSRWPMVVKRLQEELGLSKQLDVTAPSLRAEVATPLSESRLVTMHGNSEFLLRSMRALPHWADRYVVLKNCEETLTPDLFAIIKDHPRLILSGDVVETKLDLTTVGWASQTAFSKPPSWFGFDKKPWPKYIGLTKRHGKYDELIVTEAHE